MFELHTRQDIPDLLLAKLYFFTIRFLSGSVAGKKRLSPDKNILDKPLE